MFLNHLLNLKKLSNRYFIMRHGESIANIEKIILSYPENGINDYGLTEKGKVQVKRSIQNCNLNNDTIVYSSDFKRTKETAQIVFRNLKINKINYSINLRERFFGEFEKTENTNYEKVWTADKENPDHNFNNVESPSSVMDRMTLLIAELEKKYAGKNILIVSHGDPLQILLTAFKKMDPSKHRLIDHLEVAEIRELAWSE